MAERNRPVRLEALRSELRRHRRGYLIVCSFALAGPFATRFMFPEVSPLIGVLGGLLFGSYAGLCAAPERFLDE